VLHSRFESAHFGMRTDYLLISELVIMKLTTWEEQA